MSTDPIKSIMHRFPQFELSYETIPHKKVSSNYNLVLAIPYGRKYYVWFNFLGDQNVCILMELNREKRISKTEIIQTQVDPSLALGTVLYGSIEERSQSFFVIEDIFYYCGLPMKGMVFADRLGYICQTFGRLKSSGADTFIFCVPVMAQIAETAPYTPQFNGRFDTMAYIPHHLQYRCLTTTEPILNVFPVKINTGPVANTRQASTTSLVMRTPYQANYGKPQYKTPTIFVVMADKTCDIYRLYAYGSNRAFVYYGVAGIPNYHTSVMMNGIFRKIKENRNLDYIEESDDEDDFENTDETRFVDLERREHMECIFYPKFKKWVPLRAVKQGHLVVHISKL
jgi:hypothetical protein